MDFFQGDDNVNLVMLHNMLMTYVMYNFDLGYVQGMSDFASPLLYVLENEMDAFWCFVKLMERIHRNFEKDQTNIKLQMNQLRDMVMIVNPALANYLGIFALCSFYEFCSESHQSDDMYFCFRWVLVWFKREFSFLDTCKLWEVIWTNQPCPNFHLLICVAILDKEANTIIANKFGLTEILKVCAFHISKLIECSARERSFYAAVSGRSTDRGRGHLPPTVSQSRQTAPSHLRVSEFRRSRHDE